MEISLKKITLQIVLAVFLYSSIVFAQANQQVYSRIRDATNPNSLASVLQYALTIPTTTYGLQVRSGLYGYNATNVVWDALNVYAAGDSLSATADGLGTISFTLFYDGTNHRRWLGDVLSSETTVNRDYAPYTRSFLSAYDEANTTWRWLNVLPANADDLPLTRNALVTASALYGYDGAALDMLRVGAVGELQTTDIAVRPGEDAARDLRKIEITERKTYSPAKETSGAIDDDPPVVVLAAKEVLSYPNYCVFMKNLDAANSLTDVDHQVSPDNTSWVDLTEPAACDTLAAGAMCVFCVSGNAYRYVRVRALAGNGAADVDSVDVWITANK